MEGKARGGTASFPLATGLNAARQTARRYLLKQISVTIDWMPWLHARCRSGPLTAFFRAATFCGEEEFYFVAVPLYMWFFDAGNGIALVLLFAFNLYLGNWLKNSFRLPRPPLQMRADWPDLARAAASASAAVGASSVCAAAPAAAACAPALDAPLRPARADGVCGCDEAGAPAAAGCAAKLGEGAVGAPASCARACDNAADLGHELLIARTGAKDADFGWPSTHAMNAVALPFYLLRCAFPIAVWEYAEPARMWFFGLCAAAWALSVSVSRVYLGVHSPADVQGGMMLGAIVLRLWLSLHRPLTAWVVGGFGAEAGGWCAGAPSAPPSHHGPRSFQWPLWPTGLTAVSADWTADASAASAPLVPGSPTELPWANGAARAIDTDLLLSLTVLAAMLIVAHPVVAPRTASFVESVMVVGFAYGFVVGAHVTGGNAAAPLTAAHASLTNVLLCVLVGGAMIAVAKVASKEAAGWALRAAPRAAPLAARHQQRTHRAFPPRAAMCRAVPRSAQPPPLAARALLVADGPPSTVHCCGGHRPGDLCTRCSPSCRSRCCFAASRSSTCQPTL